MHLILVTGSIAYDRIMDFDGRFKEHMLPEKLHGLSLSFVVDKITENFGGTAGNVAYALALFKEKPIVLGTVGGDFEHYRAWLEEKGVDTSRIVVASNEKTASASIMTDKDNNQIAAFHPGANARGFSGEIDTAGITCGFIAANHPGDMTLFAKAFREKNLPYFFDAGQQITALSGEDLRACIEGASGIFGNEYEYGLIQKKTGWSDADMLEKTPLIVRTAGAEGTTILTREGETRVSAVRSEKVIDPTGAGDAYRGGFLSAHLAGFSNEVAARAGSVAAVFAVESYGTQTYSFSKEEFAARYREAYGEACPL